MQIARAILAMLAVAAIGAMHKMLQSLQMRGIIRPQHVAATIAVVLARLTQVPAAAIDEYDHKNPS